MLNRLYVLFNMIFQMIFNLIEIHSSEVRLACVPQTPGSPCQSRLHPAPTGKPERTRCQRSPSVTRPREPAQTRRSRRNHPRARAPRTRGRAGRSRVGATLDTRVVFRQGRCRGHLCVSSWECWNVQGLQRVRLRLAGERPARLPRALCCRGSRVALRGVGLGDVWLRTHHGRGLRRPHCSMRAG